MIYELPAAGESVDQGDLIDGCPLAIIVGPDPSQPDAYLTEVDPRRAVVLTQTCDLANGKTDTAVIAAVYDAQFLVDHGLVKAAEIRGNIRSGKVWGWYFLPADGALRLPEMLVDLRRLHAIRLDLLGDLCHAGNRRGRIKPLYREHLAKHFADTYSRIGLPRPYETM